MLFRAAVCLRDILFRQSRCITGVSRNRMAILRLCYTYPPDMTLDHQSLRSLKYSLDDVFTHPNMTQLRQLEEQTTGCLDQISHNLTDIFVNWTPLRTYSPHARFFTITDQSASIILSSYDPSPSTSETDILSAFSAYSALVTVLTIALLAFAYLFFEVYSTVHRRRKPKRVVRADNLELVSFSGEEIGNRRKNGSHQKKKEKKKKKKPHHLGLLIRLLLSPSSSDSGTSGSRGKRLSFKMAFISISLFLFFQHFFFHCLHQNGAGYRRESRHH